jgi:hypothetical protein
MPPPDPPGTIRVLPMQLRIGDQITDESGTWQVIARPYSSAGGKNTQVRVQRVDIPGTTDTRLWGSYEKVTVIRQSSFSVVPRAANVGGVFRSTKTEASD